MQQTKRFGTEEFKNGISVSKSNIDTEYRLSEDTVNVTMGNYDGLGPRYGVSPIPGHGYPLAVLNGSLGNVYNRFGTTTKTKAISPLNFQTLVIGKYDNYAAKQPVFCFVSISTQTADGGIAPATTNLFVDFNFPITTEGVSTSAGVFQRADGSAGTVQLSQPRNYIDTGVDWTFPDSSGGGPYTYTEYRRIASFLRRISVASFAVSGREYPQPYIIGRNIGTDSANNPGILSLYRHGEWQECASGPRVLGAQGVTFYTLDINSVAPSVLSAKRAYTGTATLTASSYVWSRSIQTLTNNFTPGNSFTSVLNAGSFGATAPNTLYYNPNNRIYSGYNWFGVAAGKAIIGYLKDDQKTAMGTVGGGGSLGTGESAQSMVQYIDLNSLEFFKESFATTLEGSGTRYTEDTEIKNTVFTQWPAFVSGTATVKDSFATPFGNNQNVRLGESNTGILRANSIYEITYSVFNKALNYETNVGVPAKIQTGTDDFVRLAIYRAWRPNVGDRPVAFNTSPIKLGGTSTPNSTTTNPFYGHTNHCSLRFYYRALGTYEWLPTLEIDANDFMFNPERQKLWICEDPVARAPGGQPGGFSDYSPIPKSDYHTVLQYQGRAFWISNSLFCFSMRGNPMAYPIRNQGVCPKGRFLGAIEHAYPGQAVQDSRIVIFGSEETYAGRFITGAEEQQFVRVGPDDGGTYPVEGTNFRIGSWTSTTAFSGRSAAVAKGILYFWGPQGIYMDDGRDLPVKISADLEPWIGGIYDKGQQENVFAVYNDDTDDLIWFYKPPATDQDNTPSQALVLNVKNKSFYRWTFRSLIVHSAQRVECAFDRTTNTGLNGNRIMIFAQEVGSSSNFTCPLFFDANTNGGDHSPNTQYQVTSVGSGTTSKVITLSSTIGSFAGFRLLSIVGYDRYTNKAEGQNVDGFYQAQWNSSTSLIITPTTGVTLPATETLDANKSFPVYIAGGTFAAPAAGENSIDMTLKTLYWAPGGIYAWWLYLYAHFIFKVKLLKSESTNKVTVTYQGMLDNGSVITNTLTLSDNSRSNCQILNSIAPLQNQVSGQGMQINMASTHIGGIWSLQYLGVDVVPQRIDELKTFEG
jgi:hypothetical protein